MNRAPIIRAGAPVLIVPPISADPHSYNIGAVNFGAGAWMRGPSAIQLTSPFLGFSNFTQGVISFWFNYDSSMSPSGDSAKIALLGGQGQQPDNDTITSCSNQNSNAPNFDMGCIAVILNKNTIDLLLVDASSGQALLSVSANYQRITGGSSILEWFDMGPVPPYYHAPGSTFNGFAPSPSSRSFLWIPPCANPAIAVPTYDNDNLVVANDQSAPPPNPLSGPLVLGQLYFQGPAGPPPHGIYNPVKSFPGNVWLGKFSRTGGNPAVTGWHHCICSFDTSQVVTDANGNPCIRAQMAIDGAGGPVDGGPLFDTLPGGPLQSQKFDTWNAQNGITGTLLVSASDIWTIEAPSDASVNFAYCYAGISGSGEGFYDLTVPGNINRFFTPTGTPANLGESGQNIPLDGVFMHTGDVSGNVLNLGLIPFGFNACAPTANLTKAWRSNPVLTSTVGPSL